MAKRSSQTRVGISGWRYKPWRGTFYPKDLPHKRELEFASRQFNSIELNGSFYSLQSPASWKRWYDQTPEGFVFSIKGGRFITHMRRLREVKVPLANFFAQGLLRLNEKLGPILWQFAPNFSLDMERFETFFKLLPRDTKAASRLARSSDARMKKKRDWTIDANRKLRYAIEIRNESFKTPAFVKLLRKHKIALVIADTAGKWPFVEDLTADFVYARLHGDEQIYVSGYTPHALDQWAKKVRGWGKRDAYIYFDNDVKVRAPFDAMALAKRVGGFIPKEPFDKIVTRKKRK